MLLRFPPFGGVSRRDEARARVWYWAKKVQKGIDSSNGMCGFSES